jgi:DNA replication and repair protein RecF
VLRQRNTLLKSLSGRSRGGAPGADAASTLDVWDAHLAQAGAELVEARLTTLTDVVPHLAKAYADIAPTNSEATAAYTSATTFEPGAGRDQLAAALAAAMAARRGDEIARGVSLVGPHRDDVLLSLGVLPARGYASHGESWSLALALRLGSLALLRSDGVEPVLVLDDVFAELDATRRERLASMVSGAEQVLVTAAVGGDVPAVLAGRRFRVADGTVTEDD